MRLRNVPGAKEAVGSSRWCISEPEPYRGRWREAFYERAEAAGSETTEAAVSGTAEAVRSGTAEAAGNVTAKAAGSVTTEAAGGGTPEAAGSETTEAVVSGAAEAVRSETAEAAGNRTPEAVGTQERKKLFLEIGTGKGRFITTMAGENPGILFLGLEKYASVLCKAIRKQEEQKHPNLLFIRTDAEIITEIFDTGEVDRIYLNFSDPWPKPRHEGRRLPSRNFLMRYDRILSGEGTVEFKTDNTELFDFALKQLPGSPFEAVSVTRDLHADSEMSRGNIMTEYEAKFSAMGHPICKYIAVRR